VISLDTRKRTSGASAGLKKSRNFQDQLRKVSILPGEKKKVEAQLEAPHHFLLLKFGRKRQKKTKEGIQTSKQHEKSFRGNSRSRVGINGFVPTPKRQCRYKPLPEGENHGRMREDP